MPYITSVEQIGFERGQQVGKQAGREEGREEARRSLALKMLQEKIDLETISRITEWSLTDLEQLQATQRPEAQMPKPPSDL
jgi:recombination-promoting nuclease RpnB